MKTSNFGKTSLSCHYDETWRYNISMDELVIAAHQKQAADFSLTFLWILRMDFFIHI